MSRPAIRVQSLSKRYRIGDREAREDTLIGALLSNLRRPIGNLKRLRSLSRFDENDQTNVVWALKNVTFEVQQGEVLGIIGRNGAGKSTLLKILSRITAPSGGRIELDGRVTSLLEVGTGFHPELTGRENIYLNGTILGMKKSEVDRKLDEIIAFSGIAKFIDTPLKRYSSGMGVRLAFSVAAHLEAELLLVDEVLAVGDAEFRKKCLGKMQNISQAGRTVLFVSHNLAAITNLCDKAILLDSGELATAGDAETVAMTYNREFVGTSSVSDDPGVLFELDRSEHSEEDFQIRRIELCNREGFPIPAVSTWDDVAFRLEYWCPREIPSGAAELRVRTLDGATALFLANEPDAAKPLRFDRGPGRLQCRVPRFPLAAGDYILDVGLTIPNVTYLSWNPDVALLSVGASDIFSSGLPPHQPRCLVATEFEWEVLSPGSRELGPHSEIKA